MNKSLRTNKRKTIAIVGTVVGLLAASVKTRRLSDAAEDLEIAPEGAFRLSKTTWKNVAIGAKDAFGEKNIPTLAAGVAYYSTLAFFPLLAAVVAIGALVITPSQLADLLAVTELYLPGDISTIIASQFENLVERRSDNILAAVIAISLALYGASGASKSLVVASNVIYGKKESRGWLLQQFIGVAWTVIGIVLGLIVVTLMTIGQAMLSKVGVPEALIPLILYGRWLAVLVITVTGLAVFYKYGPNRRGTKWRWVLLGAFLATMIWLAATWLFFQYIQSFANYTQSYSLFAGIIALMVWMNLSAIILLLGAEINHQLVQASRKR